MQYCSVRILYLVWCFSEYNRWHIILQICEHYIFIFHIISFYGSDFSVSYLCIAFFLSDSFLKPFQLPLISHYCSSVWLFIFIDIAFFHLILVCFPSIQESRLVKFAILLCVCVCARACMCSTFLLSWSMLKTLCHWRSPQLHTVNFIASCVSHCYNGTSASLAKHCVFSILIPLSLSWNMNL